MAMWQSLVWWEDSLANNIPHKFTFYSFSTPQRALERASEWQLLNLLEWMVASEFKMERNTPVLQEHFKGLRGAFYRGIKTSASSNVNPFTGEPKLVHDVLADHEGAAM